jgi:hypothetical protein
MVTLGKNNSASSRPQGATGSQPGRKGSFARFFPVLIARGATAGFASLLLLFAAAGCQDPPKRVAALTAERDRLADQNRALAARLTDANTQLAALQKQNATLLGLGEKRLDRIPQVARVDIGSLTGGFGREGNGPDKGVKVFLMPVDKEGSILKAPGSFTIRLFDLAAGAQEVLLGECRYDLDETARRWFSGFLTYHYSFECPWGPAGPPRHDQVTVRAEFVDYLTGKTFTAQAVAKVNPAK